MNISSWKRSRFSSLIIIVLLGCCAVLTFSSCSKKASVAIIGKWRVQGETVQFHKDGTVTSSEDPSKVTYTFTDGSHMKMEVSNGNNDTNAPVVLNCTVHIRGDVMDMTVILPGQSKPTTSHLKRIK